MDDKARAWLVVCLKCATGYQVLIRRYQVKPGWVLQTRAVYRHLSLSSEWRLWRVTESKRWDRRFVSGGWEAEKC